MLTPRPHGSQHPVVPSIEQLEHVTHVALAFMNSAIFNEPGRREWPLFTTVDEVRSQFIPGTKVMVAIGGWGDTDGFSEAARTEKSRELFADNVAKMVLATDADGVFSSFQNLESLGVNRLLRPELPRRRHRLGISRVR